MRARGLRRSRAGEALRDRLVEQAELECEHGVALLSGQSRGGKTWYGHPDPGHPPGWQGIAALYNKGRVFIDLAMHPLFQPTRSTCFAARRSTCRR